MNLLLFNLSSTNKKCYFNNIKLLDFLKLFDGETKIHVNSFYGRNKRNEYDKETFFCSKIADIKNFKKTHVSVFFDSINFSMDHWQIDISDEYEYLMTSKSNLADEFIFNDLNKIIKFDYRLLKNNIDLENQYLLVDNERLVATFHSFDEYLKSSYSSM